MIAFPNIDPVAVSFGKIKIHWYGISYLVGFYGAYFLGLRRCKLPHATLNARQLSDLLFYIVLGVILGGRLGYVFFYKFADFIHDPSMMIRVWEGGMSFHGGLIGVTVSYFVFAWREKLHVFDVADFAAPIIPFGLLCGRIGNFINGELWGRATDLPWAMVFPAGGPIARHPSMLYEAFLEGFVLLVLLHWMGRKATPRMLLSGAFLFWYGVFRLGVEFVRVPDAHLGYQLGTDWITRGMLLCLPMVLIGLIFMVLAWQRGVVGTPARTEPEGK